MLHSQKCFQRAVGAGADLPPSSLSGSVPSLAAGLLFGSLAGFGAYQISNDPSNVWVSLGGYLHPFFGFFFPANSVLVGLPLTTFLSYSHLRSADRRHGEEVLRIQEVHASWFDGWSEVFPRHVTALSVEEF